MQGIEHFQIAIQELRGHFLINRHLPVVRSPENQGGPLGDIRVVQAGYQLDAVRVFNAQQSQVIGVFAAGQRQVRRGDDRLLRDGRFVGWRGRLRGDECAGQSKIE